MGRCPYFEDDYLVHVHSPDYGKLDKHTHETFTELKERVKHVAEHGSAAELLAVQQETGINWSPDGLLWTEVFGKLQFPFCHYPDWMHTYVASGGLAQYHVNGLVLKLMSLGLLLPDLDAWMQGVTVPAGMTKLRKKYFQERIVERADAHIRAFASEMLSAITFLGLFVDVMVKPDAAEELAPYLACFDLLRVMMAILQSGNLRDAPTLQAAMQAHHELYIQLYHRIPKLHSQPHIVDFWLYWEYLLSCFGPERHHKLWKSIARFSYRHCTKRAHKRCVHGYAI